MEFIKLAAEAAARGMAVMSEDGPTEPMTTGIEPAAKKTVTPTTNGNSHDPAKLDHTRVYSVAKAVDKFKAAQDLFRQGKSPQEVWDELALK